MMSASSSRSTPTMRDASRWRSRPIAAVHVPGGEPHDPASSSTTDDPAARTCDASPTPVAMIAASTTASAAMRCGLGRHASPRSARSTSADVSTIPGMRPSVVPSRKSRQRDVRCAGDDVDDAVRRDRQQAHEEHGEQAALAEAGARVALRRSPAIWRTIARSSMRPMAKVTMPLASAPASASGMPRRTGRTTLPVTAMRSISGTSRKPATTKIADHDQRRPRRSPAASPRERRSARRPGRAVRSDPCIATPAASAASTQ